MKRNCWCDDDDGRREMFFGDDDGRGAIRYDDDDDGRREMFFGDGDGRGAICYDDDDSRGVTSVEIKDEEKNIVICTYNIDCPYICTNYLEKEVNKLEERYTRSVKRANGHDERFEKNVCRG